MQETADRCSALVSMRCEYWFIKEFLQRYLTEIPLTIGATGSPLSSALAILRGGSCGRISVAGGWPWGGDLAY